MAPQNEYLDEWVGKVIALATYFPPELPSEAWDDTRIGGFGEVQIANSLVTLVSYDELGFVITSVVGLARGKIFIPWGAVVRIMSISERRIFRSTGAKKAASPPSNGREESPLTGVLALKGRVRCARG